MKKLVAALAALALAPATLAQEARRTLDRALGREGSDVGFLPAPLEWAFRSALLAEAALVRRGFSFPLGASVVARLRGGNAYWDNRFEREARAGEAAVGRRGG